MLPSFCVVFLEIFISHPSSLTQRILSLLSDDQLTEVKKRSYYQYIVPVKKKVSSWWQSLLTSGGLYRVEGGGPTWGSMLIS